MDTWKLKEKGMMSFQDLVNMSSWEKAVLVISDSSFPKGTHYSESERSYVIENRGFGLSRDDFGKDGALLAQPLAQYIRPSVEDDREGIVDLAYYLTRTERRWKVAYCYLMK